MYNTYGPTRKQENEKYYDKVNVIVNNYFQDKLINYENLEKIDYMGKNFTDATKDREDFSNAVGEYFIANESKRKEYWEAVKQQKIKMKENRGY